MRSHFRYDGCLWQINRHLISALQGIVKVSLERSSSCSNIQSHPSNQIGFLSRSVPICSESGRMKTVQPRGKYTECGHHRHRCTKTNNNHQSPSVYLLNVALPLLSFVWKAMSVSVARNTISPVLAGSGWDHPKWEILINVFPRMKCKTNRMESSTNPA